METLREFLPFLETMILRTKNYPANEKFKIIHTTIISGNLPAENIEKLCNKLKSLQSKFEKPLISVKPIVIVKQEPQNDITDESEQLPVNIIKIEPEAQNELSQTYIDTDEETETACGGERTAKKRKQLEDLQNNIGKKPCLDEVEISTPDSGQNQTSLLSDNSNVVLPDSIPKTVIKSKPVPVQVLSSNQSKARKQVPIKIPIPVVEKIIESNFQQKMPEKQIEAQNKIREKSSNENIGMGENSSTDSQTEMSLLSDNNNVMSVSSKDKISESEPVLPTKVSKARKQTPRNQTKIIKETPEQLKAQKTITEKCSEESKESIEKSSTDLQNENSPLSDNNNVSTTTKEVGSKTSSPEGTSKARKKPAKNEQQSLQRARKRSSTQTTSLPLKKSITSAQDEVIPKSQVIASTSKAVSIEDQNNSEMADAEEIKVNQLKSLLGELNNGSTNDPQLLKSFENIIGTTGFEKLKALFTQTLPNSPMGSEQTHHSESSDAENNLPLVRPKLNTKRKRYYKNESEKLKDDIMSCFIRDAVLSVKGRRSSTKPLYNEMVKDYHETDSESDDEEESESEDKGKPSIELKDFDDEESETEDKEKSIELKGCSVALTKIDLTGLTFPVVLKNNQIQRNTPKEVIAENIENATEVDPSTINFESNANPETPKAPEENVSSSSNLICNPAKLPEIEPKISSDDDTILIDDDDIDEVENSNFCLKQPSLKIKSETLSPSSRTVLSAENTVYSLSYVECRGGSNLKCKCEKCDFQTFNHELFKYHIQTKHNFQKWSGWCEICKKSVSPDFGTLLNEYSHMNDTHIKGGGINVASTENNSSQKPGPSDEAKKPKKSESNPKNAEKKKRGRPPKNVSETNTSTTNVGSSRSTHTSITIKTTEESSLLTVKATEINSSPTIKATEPPSLTVESTKESPSLTVEATEVMTPFLKFRKLPGDKLSTELPRTPPTKSFVPESTETTEISATANEINISLTVTDEQPTFVDSSKSKEIVGDELLRPWLFNYGEKSPQNIRAMLEVNCLLAKYKCMGSDCSFYTVDMKKFQDHLETHEIDTDQDVKYFGRCPYCQFSDSDVMKLAHHIRTVHRSAYYNCAQCFYRAATKVQINFHKEKYHKDCGITLVSNEPVPLDNPRSATEEAKANRSKFIRPIICSICKSRFYCYDQFFAHNSSEHPNNKIRQRCNKCEKESNVDTLKEHLMNCHGILPYQCLHCSFGDKTLNDLKLHIVNDHGDKYPFYCVRKQEDGNNHIPSSVDSMKLEFWSSD